MSTYDIGTSWTTLQGDVATVVARYSSKQVLVSFSHPNTPIGYTRTVFSTALKNGTVKNPYIPSVVGVGYSGSSYDSVNGTDQVYRTWQNMLLRCYDEAHRKKFPTYIGVACVNEWHDLTNFKSWFDVSNYRDGYHLDKDILVSGNKLYSPETCCFVPPRINTLLIKRDSDRGACKLGVYFHEGAGKYVAQLSDGSRGRIYIGGFDTEQEAFAEYKSAKEKMVKELAHEYYDRGEIDRKVFLALSRYEVSEHG